jgi:hypothetical protein
MDRATGQKLVPGSLLQQKAQNRYQIYFYTHVASILF